MQMLRPLLFSAAVVAATLFTGCVDSATSPSSDLQVEAAHGTPVVLHGYVLSTIQLPPLGCKSLEGVMSNPIVTTTVSDCTWDASAGECSCTVKMDVHDL
jgi:hypothetical protein